jgi:hypothetical protein
MSTAYQRELYEFRETYEVASCLRTDKCKIRGIEVYIHSGNYDGEFIAYACLPVSMFIEEATGKFRATLSIEDGNYFHVYSRGVKSLKDIIRKNLKEQL